MMVFFALLLAALLGSSALVVDVGYDMVQQGAMQNAADAGAMAAGRMLAGSVTTGTLPNGSNGVIYLVSDDEVHQTVAKLAMANSAITLVAMYRDPKDGKSVDDPGDSGYPAGTRWLNALTGKEFTPSATTPVKWSAQTVKWVRTNRDPKITDKDAVGTYWLNTDTGDAFKLTSAAPVIWRAEPINHIAVQYLACNGTSGTVDTRPNFTASSDPGLVSDAKAEAVKRLSTPFPYWAKQDPAKSGTAGLGGSPDWNWTSPICQVRVHTRVSHSEMFGSVLGVDTGAATANATVRIYPTTPPTDISNVWPIVAWDDPGAWDVPYVSDNPSTGTHCVSKPGSPCVFWDSNAPPGGKFKGVVNLSRFSVLGFVNPKPEQRFDCDGDLTKQDQGCYDPYHSGNTQDKNDIDSWLRNGWRGHLYVAENDPRCTDSQHHDIVKECPNSRVELYQGTGGSNVGQPMRDYIDADPEGVDPDDPKYNFRTVAVFFWSYAEENVQTSCQTPPGSCVVNQGTLWKGPGNANNPQATGRAILSKVRLYRFMSDPAVTTNSSVAGYYVSFYNPNGSQSNGPPSVVANTVSLVG
jgi:hypothetical protein